MSDCLTCQHFKHFECTARNKFLDAAKENCGAYEVREVGELDNQWKKVLRKAETMNMNRRTILTSSAALVGALALPKEAHASTFPLPDPPITVGVSQPVFDYIEGLSRRLGKTPYEVGGALLNAAVAFEQSLPHE
jgi:hypothetical protein